MEPLRPRRRLRQDSAVGVLPVGAMDNTLVDDLMTSNRAGEYPRRLRALAAEVVASSGMHSRESAGRAFTTLVGVLRSDEVAHHGCDPRRALEPAHVERVLAAMRAAGLSEASTRTYRSDMARLREAVAPGAAPRRPRHQARPRRALEPASVVEIHRLLRDAACLPPTLRSHVWALVSLCWGAGARPGEAMRVTRGDLAEISLGGEPVVVVTLTSDDGVQRDVPIGEEEATRYLRLQRGAGAATELLVPLTASRGRAPARVLERVRAAGIETSVSPGSLRLAWLVQTAQTVPASTLLQMADIRDGHTLIDLRRFYKGRGLYAAAEQVAIAPKPVVQP